METETAMAVILADDQGTGDGITTPEIPIDNGTGEWSNSRNPWAMVR